MKMWNSCTIKNWDHSNSDKASAWWRETTEIETNSTMFHCTKNKEKWMKTFLRCNATIKRKTYHTVTNEFMTFPGLHKLNIEEKSFCFGLDWFLFSDFREKFIYSQEMITKGEDGQKNRYKVELIMSSKPKKGNEYNETIKASTNDLGQTENSSWPTCWRTTYLLDNLVFPSFPRPASFRQR